MALLENAPKTEQLIYALSDILRYSIKNSEDMVPLKTEINNIRKYLYIQHERFGNRINYDIQVDTNILNCKIPVMTLQPLVENSIIHGLEGKKEGGYVLIKGRSLMERYIAIDIIDDGIGIEEDKLKVINSTINEDNSL